MLTGTDLNQSQPSRKIRQECAAPCWTPRRTVASSHDLLYLYFLALSLSLSPALFLSLQFLLLTLQSGPKPNDRSDLPLTLHAFSCFILPGGPAFVAQTRSVFPGIFLCCCCVQKLSSRTVCSNDLPFLSRLQLTDTLFAPCSLGAQPILDASPVVPHAGRCESSGAFALHSVLKVS